MHTGRDGGPNKVAAGNKVYSVHTSSVSALDINYVPLETPGGIYYDSK